ncbi:MAG TPA: cyclophilin-like fold protein [Desulfobacterales bacterium]
MTEKKIITINAGEIELQAELNDSETAAAIHEILPVEGTANLWGEEIYFEIDLALEPEADAREAVEAGDLAYWPEGRAFCIFFGPTPASTDSRPRAYSPVNVFGRITGDASRLNRVPHRQKLVVAVKSG